MILPPSPIHPKGETNFPVESDVFSPIEVDTFDGKVTVEWEPGAAVTPIGQLPFFIQYLKMGHRFEPWVDDCPLVYNSNNAPTKRDVLGSLLLGVLSGHTRYAHIAALSNDTLNTQLLGMNKVVSDDSARRALQKIDETQGAHWLQKHLLSSYEPLLNTPWILDTDVTVKPLYGYQECAVKGYNPHKPGRPCHTFHTYMIANLRLILDVEVQAGNQGSSSHSLPGLMDILSKLPEGGKPEFIRGDCDWGNAQVMDELEQRGYQYLFKLKKSPHVKKLITQQHRQGNWTPFKQGWEAKETGLKLSGWQAERRVVLVRRQLTASKDLVLSCEKNNQLELAFIDGPENMKAFEYSVLVTNLESDLVTVVQHYRDRADCENNFDELKNQWGWGGFTTQKVKPCRLMARMIALIYNWWTLFVRMASPGSHLEAITSRPLLLSSVGRMTQSGRQKKIVITSQHNLHDKMVAAYHKVGQFFTRLKSIAPQLNPKESWCYILYQAMSEFMPKRYKNADAVLPTLV